MLKKGSEQMILNVAPEHNPDLNLALFCLNIFFIIFLLRRSSSRRANVKCVRVSVCLIVPKTEYYQGFRLFEVYTKPIDSTTVHKTSLLYKCIQN